MKGMTFGYAPDCQKTAFKGTVFLYRLQRILRTGGIKTATGLF